MRRSRATAEATRDDALVSPRGVHAIILLCAHARANSDSAGGSTPTESVTRWKKPPNDKQPIRRARAENPATPLPQISPHGARRRGVPARTHHLAHRTIRSPRVSDDSGLPPTIRRLITIVPPRPRAASTSGFLRRDGGRKLPHGLLHARLGGSVTGNDHSPTGMNVARALARDLRDDFGGERDHEARGEHRRRRDGEPATLEHAP
jgi:hypothetical protein